MRIPFSQQETIKQSRISCVKCLPDGELSVERKVYLAVRDSHPAATYMEKGNMMFLFMFPYQLLLHDVDQRICTKEEFFYVKERKHVCQLRKGTEIHP